MLKLFDLSLRLNGYSLHKAKHSLNQILNIPEADYDNFILKKRKEIVDYHLQNNPFYQQFTSFNQLDSWESLPVMTKNDLQRPLKERLSNGFNVSNCFINKTSGSSGHPMVFAKDKACHALIWANIIRKFNWYGIDFNTSYQARFYGHPVNKLDKLKLQIKDYLSRRFRLDIFDLSDTGIKNTLRHFETKPFDYINGYTSSLVLIAQYLKKKGVKLKDICPTLKVCIVTSEMLFENDKVLLETYFGIPIVNEYGASEVDLLAFQNPQNEWMLNSETTYIEIVDENNQPLPNGCEGRILVTSLYNFAHPFIRYEVGDIGCISKNSTGKYMYLEKLIGRTNDVAELPSGKRAPGMTFYSITKQIFDDNGNVKEFVIHQKKIDTFEIIYVGDRAFSIEEEKHITKVFSDYLEPHLYFHFKKVEMLERSSSGKLKQFVSELS